jgi:hypothetical protein
MWSGALSGKLRFIGGVSMKNIKNEKLEAPCKIGDTIYWIDLLGQINQVKVAGFTIGIVTDDGDSPIGNFGTSLFVSKEEAEKALGRGE